MALGVALGAVMLASATGGLGVWARSGSPEPRAAEHPTAAALAQRGGSQEQSGQRSGQPTRPQPVEDFLPPVRSSWWKDAEIQKAVGLSAAQVERLDAIFSERQLEMSVFITEHGKKLADLRKMAAERKVSTEEFAIHVASFQALTSKLYESRTVMAYRMSRELSDEQYRKLQEYRDRRSRGRSNSPNR